VQPAGFLGLHIGSNRRLFFSELAAVLRVFARSGVASRERLVLSLAALLAVERFFSSARFAPAARQAQPIIELPQRGSAG
jgi:hypothetical protein